MIYTRPQATLIRPISLVVALLCLSSAAYSPAQDETGDPDLSRLLFEVAEFPATQDEAGEAAARAAEAEEGPRETAEGAGGAGDDAEQTLRDIARYEQSISRLESEEGPYAEGLSEQLQALGRLYEETGNFERAVETYEKAMHAVRVNKGLFTLDQIEIVQSIIRGNEALNNLEEVDDKHAYLYYLKQKNYEEGSPELIRAKARWADWNVMAYHRRIGMDENSPVSVTGPGAAAAGSSDYIPVYGPNNRITYVPRSRLYGGDFGAPSPLMLRSDLTTGMGTQAFLPRRLRTARDLYEEIDETLSPGEDGEDGARQTPPAGMGASGEVLRETRKKLANVSHIMKQELDYLAYNLDSSNLSFSRGLRSSGQNPMISRGYVNGREALQANLEALRESDNASPEGLAQALIDLGDWHLSYRRPQAAFSNYAEAWKTLSEAGRSETAIRSLVSPSPLVEIPAYATHPYSRRALGITPDAPVDYAGHIDVRLDVDRYGKTRQVEVLETSQSTPYDVRRSLLEHLRVTRMRPWMEAGETVEREEVKVRYYYAY